MALSLVQVAVGEPVKSEGKPMTEINATALMEFVPVKLTVKVVATDFTLLLKTMEAV